MKNEAMLQECQNDLQEMQRELDSDIFKGYEIKDEKIINTLNEVEQQVNHLVDNLNKLIKMEEDKARSESIHVINAMLVIDAQTSYLMSYIDAMMKSVGSSKQTLQLSKKWLCAFIFLAKKAFSKMLQFICTLVTPTGWSISGDVSVNLLGFQGGTRLQVNFGK